MGNRTSIQHVKKFTPAIPMVWFALCVNMLSVYVCVFRLCAYIMHTAQEQFIAYVFHCEPSAGALSKTVEAACKVIVHCFIYTGVFDCSTCATVWLGDIVLGAVMGISYLKSSLTTNYFFSYFVVVKLRVSCTSLTKRLTYWLTVWLSVDALQETLTFD